ncbi:MAG: rod shape-determining protein MreD [Propionibacteriales bacterium]|nr:rod shape-determining protein MreD [Propionibacteriales bacterium]
MNALRNAALVAVVAVAIVLQAVVLRYVSVDGVVPNLALVLVVVVAVSRGSQFAAVFGFGAGLLLDLAPPADHVAGRWALALVVVGYLAGRVRQDARESPVASVLLVGAMSFVGTSVFALSGVLLQDGALPVDLTLRVLAISVLWDLMLAPFVVPPLLRLVDRLGSDEVAAARPVSLARTS